MRASSFFQRSCRRRRRRNDLFFSLLRDQFSSTRSPSRGWSWCGPPIGSAPLEGTMPRRRRCLRQLSYGGSFWQRVDERRRLLWGLCSGGAESLEGESSLPFGGCLRLAAVAGTWLLRCGSPRARLFFFLWLFLWFPS